ncbi:adenine deaminase [Soehngenia saccharolytica]|nr:adenine deaminase [Soehngenia saccharolytica]
MKNLLDVSMKREKADFLFKNAKIIDVFTNNIVKTNFAVKDGYIVGFGNYEAFEEIDLHHNYVAPSLIDGHVHIESSKVTPSQFAKAIVPHGVLTVVADPHEIANVKGMEGISFMLEDSKKLPLDVYIMAPSCVPATPFENSGAHIGVEEIEELMSNDRVLGLGEVMDYNSVINGDPEILGKIETAKKFNKTIDGHCPGITKENLFAYVLAGIKTEHECTNIEEMFNRLELGMYIHIREGSAARNLSELIKGVNKNYLSRMMFCTDDREPCDLIRDGSVDNNIRMSISLGLEPIDCIKMATLNTALAYNLKDIGAIAPGYKANFITFADLYEFNVYEVYKQGVLVAKNNKGLFETQSIINENLINTINMKNLSKEDLLLSKNGKQINVIKIEPGNLVTKKIKIDADKYFMGTESNTKYSKIIVVERHKYTGNFGLGLIEGFNITNGAIASTVAHDSHNVIAIGDNDDDILLAINELKKIGGGIVLTSNCEILGVLPLEIGGLMSNKSLNEVSNELEILKSIAHNKLHVPKEIEPFMALSFLALPVIPEIKITDRGLFDSVENKFIDLIE